jgi:hypothetical protein
MNYDQKNYVGKNILLFPIATYKSWGTIVGVDDLGFRVKITKAHERATFQAGTTAFIAHSAGFQFAYVD